MIISFIKMVKAKKCPVVTTDTDNSVFLGGI